MYLYQLLDEEKKLKIQIKEIEATIVTLREGRLGCILFDNLGDAHSALSEARRRLREVRKKIRRRIFFCGIKA